MTTARSIDARQRLILRERAGAIELVAGNVVLLSSAALETERAFGQLAALASNTASRGGGRVLVGGLGFGATLRGALDVLGADARVRVAEKVPAVEALVRGELAHLADRPLDDPRASVEHVDVADAIASSRGELDAILLDVDNGPHWATFRSNARLYGDAGLAAARRALAPGGILAVWSGYPADQFAARLRAAGFSSRTVPLRERVRTPEARRAEGADCTQPTRVRARAYVGSVRATA